MKRYAIECNAFRLIVDCDDRDQITAARRQGAKFIGQPLANLARWMEKFGGLNTRRIGEQAGLAFDEAAPIDSAKAG